MDKKQYHYDAFISYRHTEPDKFVAENIHKQLESFRMPKDALKKNEKLKYKIERVFRDEEELPLTDDLEDALVEALKNSDWLIVICSPGFQESAFCLKEVETFLRYHDREHVLTVLVEGEPKESFPKQLLYKTITRELPDGSAEEVRIPIEPLAADVRGTNRKEILRKMKTEKIRLLAAMFGVPYDELRRRHREQRMKRIMAFSVIVAVLGLFFGVYCMLTALQIREQKEQIEVQAMEIMEQSSELEVKNDRLAYHQALLLADLSEQYMTMGNREKARETAVMSLTEYEDMTMPVTEEGQFALMNSLRVYDIGEVYKVEYELHTVGTIDSISMSPDRDTIAICDNVGIFYLYDMKNREMLEIWDTVLNKTTSRECYDFLGENYLVYCAKYQEYLTKACVYDIQKQETIADLDTEGVGSVYCSADGKWIVLRDYSKNFIVYDGVTLEKKGQIDKMPGTYISGQIHISEEGIFTFASYETDESGDMIRKVHFADLNTASMLCSYEVGNATVSDVATMDGIGYVASTVWGADGTDYSDAYIVAIDISTGEAIWKKEHKSFRAERIELPENTDATDLLFITDGTATLYNMKTGADTNTLPIQSKVLAVNAFPEENTWRMLCSDGEILNIGTKYSALIDTSFALNCMTIENRDGLYTDYGIVIYPEVYPAVGNRLVIYTQEIGPDIVATDVEYELPENIYLSVDDGMDEEKIARSYGLQNPELVKRVMYSTDESKCFVFYANHDMVVYDVTEDRVLQTIPDMPLLEWYVGTDGENNTYIYGYDGCYVLSENMKPIMYIDNVRHIDLENGKIYLSWYDDMYEAPLYTLDELLEVAKEQ